jgi:hypothetical protein
LGPIATATIAFSLISGGAAVGIGLRRALPEHHLIGDSKDVIKEDAAKRPAGARKPHEQSVPYMIRELSPKNRAQASLQARALQLSTHLAEIQLGLSSQPPDSISRPFIDVLILWLVFIFAVFSMSSPSNTTLITVLFLCVLSASGAIYLILELGSPFDGLMQIPNDGLRSALK